MSSFELCWITKKVHRLYNINMYNKMCKKTYSASIVRYFDMYPLRVRTRLGGNFLICLPNVF